MTPPAVDVAAALHDLVHRYAAYADDRRLDELADLFLPDGVLVTPAGTFEGRDAVRQHLGALERVEATQHLVAGEVFEQVDGTGATGRVVAQAHHRTGDRDHVWHVVYRDSYVRRERRWCFARRTIELRWTEDRTVSRPAPTQG